MPEFAVVITRHSEDRATVRVEARDTEEAEHLALRKAQDLTDKQWLGITEHRNARVLYWLPEEER